jgi:hypothetical protein
MMDHESVIQKNIYEHGPIHSVMLLDSGEYIVKHTDSHSYSVADPRVGTEGPILSLELHGQFNQSLWTNFENLWSAVIFRDREGKDHDEEVIPPTKPALEHA